MHHKNESLLVEEGYFSDRTFKSLDNSSFNILTFNDTSSPVQAEEKSIASVNFWDNEFEYSGTKFLFGRGILLDRIQEAQKTIEKLKTHIGNYDNQIQTLKLQNENLIETIKQEKNENIELRKKIENKNDVSKNLSCVSEQLSSLLDVHQMLLKNNEKLNADKEELSCCLEKEKIDHSSAMKKIQSLEIDLENFQSKYDETESQLDNKIKILIVENENLCDEYKQVRQQLDVTEDNVEKLECNIQSLKHEKEIHEKTKKDLGDQLIEEFNNKNKYLEENLKLKRQLENLAESNINSIMKSQHMSSELLKCSKELKEKCDFITKTNEQLKITEEKIYKAKQTIAEKDVYIHQLDLNKKQFEFERDNFKNKINVLKEDKVKLIRKLKCLHQSYVKQQNDILMLKENFNVMLHNNKVLLAENNSQRETLKNCKIQMNQLVTENENLNINIAIADKKSYTSISCQTEPDTIVKEKDEIIEEKKGRIQKLLDETSQFEACLFDKNKTIDQLQKDKIQQDSKLTELNSHLRHIEETRQREVKVYNDTLQKHANDEQSFQETQRSLQSQNNKLKEQVTSLEKQFAVAKEKWNLEKFEISCTSKSTIKGLEAKLLQSERFSTDWKNEKKKLLIRIENLKMEHLNCFSRSEVEKMNDKLSEQKQHYEEKLKEMNLFKMKEKERYDQLLKQKNIIEEKLNSNILLNESLTDENNKLNDKQTALKNLDDLHMSTVTKLEEELQKLKTEISSLNKTLREKENKIVENDKYFNKQYEKLQSHLAEERTKKESFHEEYQTKKLQTEKLKKQLKQLENDYDRLSSEYCVLKNLNTELESINDKLKSDHENMLNERTQCSSDLEKLKCSYENLLSNELSKQKTEFLYKENQLLKRLAAHK